MSDEIDLTPWKNHDGPPPDFDSPVYPVFDSGVTWTIGQLAVVLNIDCNDFSWDAATEEFEGDVRAVIGNAITAALGEEWSDLRAENARLRDALRNSRVAETMLIAGHLRDKAKKAEEMPAGFTIECVQPSDVAVILRCAADAIDLRARAALETKKAPGDDAEG